MAGVAPDISSRTVQDFLGHADPRMTAKYAHVVDMAFFPLGLR